MILDQPRKYRSYEIYGVPGNFSRAPDGIQVSIRAALMPFIRRLSLTRTAWGLWSLYGLQQILLPRKPHC